MAVALTTIDNPYDPITDFDNFQKEQAIDEILAMDQSGFYKKVEKDIK